MGQLNIWQEITLTLENGIAVRIFKYPSFFKSRFALFANTLSNLVCLRDLHCEV